MSLVNEHLSLPTSQKRGIATSYVFLTEAPKTPYLRMLPLPENQTRISSNP